MSHEFSGPEDAQKQTKSRVPSCLIYSVGKTTERLPFSVSACLFGSQISFPSMRLQISSGPLVTAEMLPIHSCSPALVGLTD